MRILLFQTAQYVAKVVEIDTVASSEEASALKKAFKLMGKIAVGTGLAALTGISVSAFAMADSWLKEEREITDKKEEEEETVPVGPEPSTTEYLPETVPAKVTKETPKVEVAKPKEKIIEQEPKKSVIAKTREMVKPVITPTASVEDLSKVKVNKRSAEVSSYIDEASKLTGVDKAVILAVANQESSFKENAAASTSSAIGLLQLETDTWDELVTKYGKQFGIEKKDRKDPRASTIMGAVYIRAIINSLTNFLKRAPSITDIYAGHFLGPSGVKKLLTGMQDSPNTDASEVLPNAAKSNPAIFKNKDGSNKTLRQVYETLYSKVGLQYQKFAQEEGIKTQYASSSYGVLPKVTEPEPTQVATGAGPVQIASVSNATPIAFSASTPVNTVPVEVEFKAPPKKEEIIETQQKQTKEEKTQVAAASPNPEQKDTQYIRKNGRLLTLG